MSRATLSAILLLTSVATAGEPVDVAVGRDGQILKLTEMEFDAAANVLRWKKRTYELSALYLIETKDGTLVWAADYDSRLRGYELMARAAVRDESARLFKAALRYKDGPLARRLFELAQDNGLNGKDAEKFRERLKRLEAKPRTPSRKADEVRAETGRLASIHADLLLERTTKELAKDKKTGLRMLRDLLRLQPKHAAALRELARLAPKEFALGGPRAWLDWQLDIEGRGATLAPSDTFAMRQATKYWRKDLNGIRTGPALVITPVRDTRILGRTLGCCRLTTDLLESHFASYPKRRKKFEPLRIFLYQDREEYKKQTKSFRPSADTSFLEMSAGHYSPDEGISRLFWSSAVDAEQRTVATAVHELTHHWLAEANPAYNRTEGRRSPRCPGFWIVEGFAKFLEEGVYDLDRGTWSLFDRRAASLDTVASMTKGGKLIPWTKLYEGTSVTFWALPKKTDIKVRRRWLLGAQAVSTTQLWYEQSAATCQFLYHAENGKYKKALLDYVVNHYTRKKALMDTQKAFGLTPAELGARVEKFAKAVAEGWEPEGK
ncbi:MAG: hypothetical protein ACYTGZ_09885 [Planctomycetota bacterium]|jgi:hypothetical protein